MLVRHLFELVQEAASFGKLAEIERPSNPCRVGRGDLVEQTGKRAVAGQQLAQQSQAAFMVARDQGCTAFGE